MSPELRIPTAGVIIIGDEILNGSVDEQNAAFFIARFRALGTRLSQMVFIEDDLDEIAKTVRAFAARFDHVCTTGGIGPTHDDVTLDAIAEAFDRPLVQDPVLLARMQAYVGDDFGPGYARLCRIPEGSELIALETLRWPLLCVENVYVFPGVPWMLRERFEAIEARMVGVGRYRGHVMLTSREAAIAADLDALVARHPHVSIGSYPRRADTRWTVKITVESLDSAAAEAALDDLQSQFGSSVIDTQTIAYSGPEAV